MTTTTTDQHQPTNEELYRAAKVGNAAFFRRILAANPDLETRFSREPVAHGEFVFSYFGNEWEEASERTVLHVACAFRKTAVVRALLDRVDSKIDVNVKDKWNQTPLHLVIDNASGAAADHSSGLELMDLLIQHGANVNAVDARSGRLAYHVTGPRNYTPLHVACAWREERRTVVEKLLAAGADPNAKDATGHTPLHLACSRGLVSVVDLLVRHGADVNATDNKGRTALFFAANRNTAEALVKNHHADMRTKDNYGYTALDFRHGVSHAFGLAVNLTTSDFLRLYGEWALDQHGDKSLHFVLRHTARYTCRRRILLELVTNLVSRRPACAQFRDNETNELPLHVACATNTPVAVIQLMAAQYGRHDTLWRTQDNKGNTPLHRACAAADSRWTSCGWTDWTKLISFLIDQDSHSLLIPNQGGSLPIHALAATYISIPKGLVFRIVPLMINNGGADLFLVRDLQGHRPLYKLVMAATKRETKTERELLRVLKYVLHVKPEVFTDYYQVLATGGTVPTCVLYEMLRHDPGALARFTRKSTDVVATAGPGRQGNIHG